MHLFPSGHRMDLLRVLRAEIRICIVATDAPILAEGEQEEGTPVVCDAVIQRTAPRITEIPFTYIRSQPLRPGLERFEELFKAGRILTDIGTVLIDRRTDDFNL